MNSTTRRLFLWTVGLLGTLLLVNWIVSVIAARAFADDLAQRLGASIAMYVAAKGPLLERGVPERARLDELAAQARVLNPAARVHVLDAGGHVVWPAALDWMTPARIPLEVLERFLGAQPLRGPVYGPDPHDPRRESIFSAAAIRSSAGREGFVYVLLGGTEHAGLIAVVGGSYVLRVAAATAACTLLLAAVAAWALSTWTTRPVESRHARIVATGDRLRRAPAAAPARRRAADLDEVEHVLRTLADQVAAQLHDLESTDRLRRELFAHVSHDLRTPLTAMQAYLETLATEGERLPAARRGHFLDIATRHCTRLRRLVDRIFLLARLDAATLPARTEPLVRAELAQDVVAKWQLAADHAGVSIRLAVDPDAPRVLGDVSLLENVLENLIGNAARHCARAGSVRVAVGRDRTNVRVTVADDGPGIDAAILARVQEPFVAGPGGGSGLGLAIVRRVLQVHGSALVLESAPGRGTVAAFALPAIAHDARRDEFVSAGEPERGGARDTSASDRPHSSHSGVAR